MATLILQQKGSSFSLAKKVTVGINLLNLWFERHHQRKQLAQLDERMKRDLGLDDAQIQAEISKPFWK